VRLLERRLEVVTLQLLGNATAHAPAGLRNIRCCAYKADGSRCGAEVMRTGGCGLKSVNGLLNVSTERCNEHSPSGQGRQQLLGGVGSGYYELERGAVGFVSAHDDAVLARTGDKLQCVACSSELASEEAQGCEICGARAHPRCVGEVSRGAVLACANCDALCFAALAASRPPAPPAGLLTAEQANVRRLAALCVAVLGGSEPGPPEQVCVFAVAKSNAGARALATFGKDAALVNGGGALVPTPQRGSPPAAAATPPGPRARAPGLEFNADSFIATLSPEPRGGAVRLSRNAPFDGELEQLHRENEQLRLQLGRDPRIGELRRAPDELLSPVLQASSAHLELAGAAATMPGLGVNRRVAENEGAGPVPLLAHEQLKLLVRREPVLVPAKSKETLAVTGRPVLAAGAMSTSEALLQQDVLATRSNAPERQRWHVGADGSAKTTLYDGTGVAGAVALCGSYVNTLQPAPANLQAVVSEVLQRGDAFDAAVVDALRVSGDDSDGGGTVQLYEVNRIALAMVRREIALVMLSFAAHDARCKPLTDDALWALVQNLLAELVAPSQHSFSFGGVGRWSQPMVQLWDRNVAELVAEGQTMFPDLVYFVRPTAVAGSKFRDGVASNPVMARLEQQLCLTSLWGPHRVGYTDASAGLAPQPKQKPLKVCTICLGDVAVCGGYWSPGYECKSALSLHSRPHLAKLNDKLPCGFLHVVFGPRSTPCGSHDPGLLAAHPNKLHKDTKLAEPLKPVEGGA
jgi:hypothetical protein